ncbi:MAG: NADH-quinone oxidoreductase subunit N, partial [Hyphomicrobiaceae bacterium]|nr:NADH-quinone oxidoreductase subunit N [Hyphomicrobiaceae bacterium]
MQHLSIYAPVLPEIVVAVGAMALLMFGVFRKATPGGDFATAWLAIGVLLLAAVLVATGTTGREAVFDGAFIVDGFARFMKILVIGGAVLVIIMSFGNLARQGLLSFEYAVLLLLAVLGMMLMISAGDLIALYLGIELQSLSLYVVAAIKRDEVRSSEAGLKYFVLGALSSGMLLYGASLIYGFTGSVDFGVIASVAQGQSAAGNIGLTFGLVFLLIGIAFKISAVPFHMWTPDVYQGAPTPVTLFIGSAPKIAAFAMAMRLLTEALGGLLASWQDMLTILAVLSLVIGNVIAIAQTNIKRMLGYSTIAHVGFILLALFCGTEQGNAAALFYTLTYVIAAAGAFGMIILLSRRGYDAENLTDFKGLNARSP